MLSQRRMRRMLLVPCVLCLILYTAQSFFNAVTLVRPRQTNILTTATVTILEQETATLHVDFQQEFEEPLQPHVFRSDGLLEVNPNGRHPMYDLIERAEAKWAEKLKRQSKSLDEAVSEYERRYHRAPPKGFDDWCGLIAISKSTHSYAQQSTGGSIVNTTTSNYPTSTISYITTWSHSGEWTQ
jgi:hypothetical protein